MSNVSIREFADDIDEVMPVIMKEFARRQVNELYKGKVTFPQFLILEVLNADGEYKMKDLAHTMHVTTAAMTGIVDRLVKYGYAVRVYDPNDRRIVKVKLTSRGTDLLKKISEQRRQMTIKIFSKISESDRKDYLRILMHIKEILTKEDEALK